MSTVERIQLPGEDRGEHGRSLGLEPVLAAVLHLTPVVHQHQQRGRAGLLGQQDEPFAVAWQPHVDDTAYPLRVTLDARSGQAQNR